ncbi:MAG: hypothetical protein JWO98_5306 [Frankiales bacterium]|nr:hypothetical protein [Frankiales bacterium]
MKDELIKLLAKYAAALLHDVAELVSEHYE